jgi:hypothetical protein
MAGFMEWLTRTHTCECGAKYLVRVTRTPFPDADDARCEECGQVMDSRRNSTRSQSYERID